MTNNDLELNEYNFAIRTAGAATSKAMRDNDRTALRRAYKEIFEKVWAGLNRLDELDER